MEQRNDKLLLIISILLGISVLKLTEVFQLGEQIRSILFSKLNQDFSPITIGVFVFISGYIIFYSLVALVSFGIIRQLSMNNDNTSSPNLAPIVGMCVTSLTISYLAVFFVMIYGLH